jgi:short subunit dehydrogenase-like uncharacterized protein
MVLVFGATGYTGRMVVQDLVDRGVPVRIAGRSQERLEKLSARHDGLDWVVADVKDPPSVSKAAVGTTALITTVGPYTWWGHISADAALEHGIPYIDITGEPGWVRQLFEEYGPKATEAGIAMMPAMGYDYVPGNLAGALALEAASGEGRSIDIGYFLSGQNSRSLKSLSGGTLRSLRASSTAMQFAFRDGRIVEERGAKRVLEFDFGDRKATAVSIGGTEHYGLSRLHPELQTVNVGLGWFGAASRAVKLFASIGEQAERIPGVRTVIEKTTGGSGQTETKGRSEPAGPNDDAREQARTNVIAVVRDGGGEIVSQVELDGPNPYDLTGRIVGWAAEQSVSGGLKASGTITPVEAFGLEELRAACEQIGLNEV